MKNLLILLTLFFAGVNSSIAQDFRGMTWGNSLGAVQKAENLPLLAKVNNDQLIYSDVLGGSDCNVIYIFNDNDKMISGMYVFTKKYNNPQIYIQDYTTFKSLLTEKYGKPVAEQENRRGSSAVSEKHNYGQAVADGELSLNTVWNTDRSVIKLLLVQVDKHPELHIYYTTRNLNELENKEVLKEALKKL